jgi:hypothetical protein
MKKKISEMAATEYKMGVAEMENTFLNSLTE